MKNWHDGVAYYEPEFPNILFAKDGEIYDLDEIAKKVNYSKWYFGHYHDNIQYVDAELLYGGIQELGYVQKVGRPRYKIGEKVYFTFGKENNQEGYGKIEWVDDDRSIE